LDQSNPKNYLESEKCFFENIGSYFQESSGTYSEKAHAFPRFTPRQALSYFLARTAIFQKILPVHGSIMDFGIYRGSSFFTWQQLSAILEPYNHIRKVIGFDSFQGFSELGTNDSSSEGGDFKLKAQGGMAYDGAVEMQRGIELFNLNRPLGHIEKGQCLVGELPGLCRTYLAERQETIIALANFGLGLYTPTLELLKLIKPRLIKGSIVVFEDLNQATWPGETTAFFELFHPTEVTLNRVPYCPHISWVEIGA